MSRILYEIGVAIAMFSFGIFEVVHARAGHAFFCGVVSGVWIYASIRSIGGRLRNGK